MIGAETYVNDQWSSCGLGCLPQGPESHRVILKFVIPRDARCCELIEQVCEMAEERLAEAYPSRQVIHEPIDEGAVEASSEEAVEMIFHVSPLV